MGMVAFYGEPMPEEESIELLVQVYSSGVTHFDTAEMYRSGRPLKPTPDTQYSEVILGKFLKRVGRENVTVATKMWPDLWENKCDLATVEAAVDASLARLDTGYIDLYYMHRMFPEGPDEWMASVKALIAKGKVRNVGLSEATPENIRRAHQIHPIAAVQQEWSLLTRNLENTVVPCCVELGIAVVAYSPLARGLLCALETPPSDWRSRAIPRFSEGENFAKNKEMAEKIKTMAAKKGLSSAALSLAWLHRQAKIAGVALVSIPGSRKVSHCKENLQACSVELSDSEAAQLEEIAQMCAGERGNAGYLEMAIEGQLKKNPIV